MVISHLCRVIFGGEYQVLQTRIYHDSFHSSFTGVQIHLGSLKTVAKMRRKVSASFSQIKAAMISGLIQPSPVSLNESTWHHGVGAATHSIVEADCVTEACLLNIAACESKHILLRQSKLYWKLSLFQKLTGKKIWSS